MTTIELLEKAIEQIKEMEQELIILREEYGQLLEDKAKAIERYS
jgi:hypothetical protein